MLEPMSERIYLLLDLVLNSKIFLLSLLLFSAGCGVKSDPTFPEGTQLQSVIDDTANDLLKKSLEKEAEYATDTGPRQQSGKKKK